MTKRSKYAVWAVLASHCLLASVGLAESARRELPDHYTPGEAFDVTLLITPENGVFVYAAEEQIPEGWTIGLVTHGGSFDQQNSLIKWGPFFDDASRNLSYGLTPPVSAAGEVVFIGTVSFDGANESVAGDSILSEVATTPDGGENPSGAAVRDLPDGYTKGQTLDVVLSITPKSGVGVYAAEELIPGGWTVGTISDGGSYDDLNKLIKWGPFFDASSRDLTYELSSPASAAGELVFIGTVSFDGVNESVAGDSILSEVATTPDGAGNPIGGAVRDLPDGYTEGQTLDVVLSITPENGIGVYAAEEQVPAGWTVGTISGGGSYDEQNSQIKWGPFFDASSRNLSYELTPPVSATGEVAFRGTVSFDGSNELVAGEDRIGRVDPSDPPGAVVVARIDSLNLVTGLGAILVVEGTPGADVSIDTSTDLIQWREVGALKLNGEGSGSFIHSEADLSANNSFFRVLVAR